MNAHQVIVLELNEVPWRVLDWWTVDHPDGALARLVDESETFTTVAADEGHLSPWVTWPTVHRGVANTVHGIAHFGQPTDEADRIAPAWWSTLADAGCRVGIFGLLHTSPLPEDVDRYAFWVPDPFAADTATHPTSLRAFQEFNLRMSRASARNVASGVDPRSALRFVVRAPSLGVRPTTALRIARQLLDERREPRTRVRRRSLQSVLAFDLFSALVDRTRPHAAAFFTNHVASAMHRYWAATFPGDYPPGEFGFDDEWVRAWGGELSDALAHADRMVGRLLRMADESGAVLVVCSSMGQAAAQGTPVRRQLYLRDVGRFLVAAGLDPDDVEQRPAMDPHVNVRTNAAGSAQLGSFLDSVRVAGAPVEWSEDGGLVSMTFGQADDHVGPVEVGGVERDASSIGLEVVDIEDEVSSTGYHVPEGCLLVHGRAHVAGRERPPVPTTAVAPLLHELVGVPPAAHHTSSG